MYNNLVDLQKGHPMIDIIFDRMEEALS